MKKLDEKALRSVKGGTFGHKGGGYDKGGHGGKGHDNYGSKKSGKHC